MGQPKQPDFSSSTASSNQNETLESFAVAQKMTVSNVKNMIYHILTDATLFATLVDSDKQAIPHIRLTRSRWREIQQKVNVEHPPEINLNPVAPAKSFLDIDFGNNEDDDPEYDPTNEFFQDCEDDPFQYDADPEDLLLKTSEYEYLTNHMGMDPDYFEFVIKCLNPDINLDVNLSDEEGDEEYNVMSDEKNLEKTQNKDTYEFRDDRSTQISSREISALWGDFDIDVELHRPNKHQPPETPLAIPPSSFLIQREHSSSIFEHPVRLNGEEVKILKSQFEQHLQLLYQAIVGCNDKPELLEPYSNVMTMFNELVGDGKPPAVFLDPDDLDQCHNRVYEIYNKVPEVLPEYTSEVRPPPTRKSSSAEPLSNKSRWIYAKSSFIHYPALLPSVEFQHFNDSFTAFLPYERALLAFGLFVFQRVPLGSARQPMGRYQCIQKYLLPIRSAKQLRVHIKHCREKKENADSLAKFLVAAADGNFTLSADRLVARAVRENGLPLHWPKKQQPKWLKELAAFQMVYKKGSNMYSGFIIRDNQLLKPAMENMPNSEVYFELFLRAVTPTVPTVETYEYTDPDPTEDILVQPDEELRQLNTVIEIADNLAPSTSYTNQAPSENSIPPETAVFEPPPVDSVTSYNPSPHYSDTTYDQPTYEAPMDPAEGTSRSSYQSDRHTESTDEFSHDADTRSSDVPEPAERTVEDSANDFEPFSEDERSRTLQRRHVDVLKALTDPENRHKAFEGLVAAVQNDINRRFFMHEEKLKKFRAIVSQPSKPPAEILEELRTALDDVDQEIIFVLASLLHDEQLTPWIRQDPRFHRIKKALDMIMDVQTYVYGTRGLKTLKHIAKSFRNEQLNNVDELKAILKNLFRRDPKVCNIFLPDESCETSNSKYEEINLSDINRAGIENKRVTFETIEIPYKRPCHQSLRAQPQLYHGHIIHEQSGVEVHCDIRYESKFEWSDAADLDLLKQVLVCGTDYNFAAKAFCALPKYSQVTMVDAMDRLIYLRSVNNS
uniref:GON-4-like protein n=1 Tax=Panagrellus redivivus TaxID=6233 RepID=A0A7E4W3W7_PANRE